MQHINCNWFAFSLEWFQDFVSSLINMLINAEKCSRCNQTIHSTRGTCGVFLEFLVCVFLELSHLQSHRYQLDNVNREPPRRDIMDCAFTQTVLCFYRSRCSPLTSTLNDGHRRRGSEARVSQEHSQSPLMTHTHQRSERNTNTYSNKWVCWQTKGPPGSVNYLLSRTDELSLKTFLSPCFLRRRPGL